MSAAFHCVKLVLAGRPAPVRRLHFYLCGRRSARRTVQDWRHGCGEQRPLGYTRFPFMNIDFASGDGGVTGTGERGCGGASVDGGTEVPMFPHPPTRGARRCGTCVNGNTCFVFSKEKKGGGGTWAGERGCGGASVGGGT